MIQYNVPFSIESITKHSRWTYPFDSIPSIIYRRRERVLRGQSIIDVDHNHSKLLRKQSRIQLLVIKAS